MPPVRSYDDELAAMAQTLRVKEELAYRKAVEEAANLIELPDTTVRTQLTEEYVEPLWRVENLHIASSFTTITAAYKTGKSTLMVNLIKSLLDGRPFLGQRVMPVTRKVAYWNMELDKNVWLQWIQEAQILGTDRLVPLHLRGERFPIYHPELNKRIVEWLRRNEIEVLIIDPGAKLLRGWPVIGGGGVENSNDVVADVCHRLRLMVKEGGVTDLFVPLHTGHAFQGESQHSRGATMWLDEPDHLWNFWKKPLFKGDEDEIRHFKAEGRNVDFDTILLEYDKKTHLYTPEANPEALLMRGRAKAVVVALARKGEPMGVADLRKATKGVGNEIFPEVIEEAIRRGYIEVERVGRTELHRLVDSDEVREIAAFHGGGMEEL